MIAAILKTAMAAAFIAAASVQTPAPFPANPPTPARGAHCPAGSGLAIGDPVGKSAYVRQEMQIVTADRDEHLVGYVYDASDGNDYLDLTPSIQSERIRPVPTGEFPMRGAILRPCFSDAWTMPWGKNAHSSH